jgi:hypothetical protein
MQPRTYMLSARAAPLALGRSLRRWAHLKPSVNQP